MPSGLEEIMAKSLTYADAGVDIDKANDLVGVIKTIAAATRRSGVMGDIGGFGGMFSLNVTDMKQPVLVSSTDGVGTKLKIAFEMGIHDTVGIDLVGMCVNDILVQGAQPLFFLDYLSMGKLDNDIAADIVRGIGEGCKQAKCALIGGETAEMPGFYPEGEYDMAGFAVGVVNNPDIIDGSDITRGHQLIGLASSGIHSNGFSLVRKICFDVMKLKATDQVEELGKSLGEELLTPTRIYSQVMRHLIRDFPVHGIAHITGGGIPENIIRVVPEACTVRVRRGSWDIPPIFKYLQNAGNVEDLEMMRTFNCGVGMVLIVPESKVQEMMDRLASLNEKAWVIGDIVERKAGEPHLEWK
jgi:phosphoribosylformylglycinamidine cyclo-ligase